MAPHQDCKRAILEQITSAMLNKKAIFIILFLLLVFLIWAELGVGIFGTPWAGN